QHVINFFTFVAEELREIMAELGFKTINEMVGQTEFLKSKENINHWKSKSIDLNNILYKVPADNTVGLYKQVEQEHDIETELNMKMIMKAQSTIEKGEKVKEAFKIINTDRACGTTLSYL